jgi:AcrR family transcriptional regulator
VADIARDAGVSGTLAYAYFPNKEALFLAAVDEDAAAVIHEGVTSVLAEPGLPDWQGTIMVTLVAAVDRHPLARRLLAGLEPEVTTRVLDLPALAELRKAVTERLRTGQLDGTVRADIDAASLANGAVAVTLSILMSLVQLGVEAALPFAVDVNTLISAAIDPPPD